eukprot:CAMPEP_0204286878 /NCGR_PEP_ID=MMETSP0468-20130131/53618_1 /ASSEMBLY_ACC=CAM_ASM_000383 /TAXON_ID=2969 /ORGANISM="Oxyrrhis marina" /LENGTH=38 /DNA_ID= /DNA_START= /DNA_END= /DNA_ORIENTATION=
MKVGLGRCGRAGGWGTEASEAGWVGTPGGRGQDAVAGG